MSHSCGSHPERQAVQCVINTVDMKNAIVKQQTQHSIKVIVEPHSFSSSVVTISVQKIQST